MHLVTSPDIESDNALSRYLCPYQVEGVLCEADLQVTEKANRIGWTWLDALKNVRLRLMHKKRDYLFTTQNWNGALEYGQYLHFWLNIYNLGRFLISTSTETMTFMRETADGRKVAVEEKVGVFKFDGGSRIILFSSAPWALQTFEGDVGWDEAAFHDQQEKMWAAISTRLQWGYKASVWSAHNGVGSWFNQVLLKIAKEPGSGWHHRKITIYDAIKDGIVAKINERSGKQQTEEEFLASCRKRALTPEIFAERFECAPSDAGTNLAPWSVIERACTQSILRHHVDNDIARTFGSAHDCTTDAQIMARMKRMKDYLRGLFAPLLMERHNYRLGFDVAASGEGDLGSIWLSRKVGTRLQQAALLTTQTDDWHFINAAVDFFMTELPGIKGCGDKTGLGREVTWKMEQKHSGRFEGVIFSKSSKGDMGARLMNLLTSAQFEIAKVGSEQQNADIGMDLFSLQRHSDGGGITFTETQNPLNSASHCDIAWSAALAARADALIKGGEGRFNFHSLAPAAVGVFHRAKSLLGGTRRRMLP